MSVNTLVLRSYVRRDIGGFPECEAFSNRVIQAVASVLEGY